ncbi:hypothetical protein ACGF0J_14020 [Nonomuraea sp. NPDC047897]|uniref:hypothetical protein n=1 Tax=Nonomuraea sp. NPDC047897 TaxID=3364346 RepID=UPI0037118073
MLIKSLDWDNEDTLIAICWIMFLPAVTFFGVVRRLRRLAAKAEEERTQQAELDPRERLRKHIDALNAAFAQSMIAMEDLKRDIEVQQAIRDDLIAQAEEHRETLAVEPEHAERTRRVYVRAARDALRAERGQQWMFFALGALISIPIGVAINLLVP